MKTFAEKHLPLVLLGIISCTMLILTIISEGYFGGADNINHFFLSRYSFQYHLLFFDSWGRPLYTILSSPFAQVGFVTAKLLNVLFGMCTAFFAYLIAKRLDIKPSYLVIIFVVFTPIYCVMLPTALTEILFGLVLVLSILFFFRENFIASAIVLSFLPFARNEGIIILPVFFLAYLLKRKFKPIPFLLTGFVVLSIIGSFFYKDLLWIIHHPAYAVHSPAFYGKGPLLYFFNNYYLIFGNPMAFLFLAGSIWLLVQFVRKKWSFKTDTFFVILVILVPFVGYFIFHSILFWQALGGSLGLLRVIAAVLPLAAIVALMGYQWMIQLFFKHPWQHIGFMVITSFAVIMACFKIYPFPVKLSPEEKLIKTAASWVKATGLGHKKIIFTDLNVPFYLELDPYNGTQCSQKWFVNKRDPDPETPDSTVFIWDSHFGPNECQVPLYSLMNNPRYKLINRFLPSGELKTLGGHDYEVDVFLRLPEGVTADNAAQLEILKKAEENNLMIISSKLMNFEDAGTNKDTANYTKKTVFSGSQAYKVGANAEFSPGIEFNCATLVGKTEGLRIKVSVAIFPLVSFTENPALLVISVENGKESYQYSSFPLEEKAQDAQQWNPVEVTVSLPEIRSSSDRIKVYLWHQGKQEFYMDELKADILVLK